MMLKEVPIERLIEVSQNLMYFKKLILLPLYSEKWSTYPNNTMPRLDAEIVTPRIYL